MAWVNRGPLGLGNWVTDEDGRQIAVTYGERVNARSAEDTALIAAAPDLLDALKDIASHDLIGLRDPYRIILQAMIDTAKSAISKAEVQP